jgi:16S rRNA (uracil1498-N3)-methyltransferase
MLPRLLIRDAGSLLTGTATEPIRLEPAQARYLAKVLRLQVGDPLQVFDGRGGRYGACVARIEAGECLIRLEQALPSVPPGRLFLTLAQCLSSADKMDWTIEKAVELGASSIVPLFSERSLIRLDRERGLRKLEHWQAIVEAACMQSGQDRLPDLSAPMTITQWLERATPEGIRLVLSPSAVSTLVEAIERSRPEGTDAGRQSITLVVGPESGLSHSELDQFTRSGFEPVRMGPRVLRTETAGLAALAAIGALAGDFR